MYTPGSWLKSDINYKDNGRVMLYKDEFYKVRMFVIFDGCPCVFLEEVQNKAFHLRLFTPFEMNWSIDE